MKPQNFKDLIAWQKSMDMAEAVYAATRGFPKEELYGLTSQVRRAAVSVPSNIAEGQARFSTAEFQKFLSISQGSRAEVETQMLLAQRLGYITDEPMKPILALLLEVKRLLHGLQNSLKN